VPQYSHLHCHSQFSLLDGAAPIDNMFAKAKADGQRAVALTDHGNMFGAFKFVNSAKKHGVKAIVGCEFYLVEDRFRRSFVGEETPKTNVTTSLSWPKIKRVTRISHYFAPSAIWTAYTVSSHG